MKSNDWWHREDRKIEVINTSFLEAGLLVKHWIPIENLKRGDCASKRMYFSNSSVLWGRFSPVQSVLSMFRLLLLMTTENLYYYYTKITTSTWYIWVFSLPVCWIVDGYCVEKLHRNHFWEFKGWTKQFLEMQSIITYMPICFTLFSCQYTIQFK